MPETTKLDWPQLMEEALTAPGHLGQTYSRFHDYSLTNEVLFLMQGMHEPVGSRSTWRALGRIILNGARPKQVIVPVLIHEQAPTLEGPEGKQETLEERRERVARLIGFKLIHGVFPLSDTEGKELPDVSTPGWDLQTALDSFGIKEVPFDSTSGNLQGYSRGLEFAINPIAANRNKTVFHELMHIVLGHTLPHHYEEYQAHRGIMEGQAESGAYILMNELVLLDEETASTMRGYIRHWLKDEQFPDQAIRQVFTGADRVLRAGRTAVAATER